MADVNKEAVEFWNSLKPMIDEEIKTQTRGMVQRRKMKVTTAPSLNTNKIGVTEPFGTEMLIPFTTNLISATVGDVVWVEFMYGLTNAFASMFASADEKDWDVAGNLSVIGNAGIGGNLGVSGSTSLQNTTVNGVLDIPPRRCYANLSQAGWYRVCKTADISGTIIDFSIGRPYGSSPAEAHRISFYVVGGGKSAFLDETSDSNTLLVDKIRCTNGDGFMYFDIHYTASSSNQVLVYFDVSGKGQENQSTVAESLQSVADSPSGETVLTEYTFAANRRSLLTTNIFRIRRTYSDITISSNNGYILLDSFENMGVSSQNYCLGFNIVGWSGFPTYGFQIMRGSNATSFYLASSVAGTFGSFTVEYWFADLYV